MSTRTARFLLSRSAFADAEAAFAVFFFPGRGASAKRWRGSAQPGTTQVNIMANGSFSENSEMLRDQRLVAAHLRDRARKSDAAGVEDDDVVGQAEGELDVLLDQHDRLPGLLQ